MEYWSTKRNSWHIDYWYIFVKMLGLGITESEMKPILGCALL